MDVNELKVQQQYQMNPKYQMGQITDSRPSMLAKNLMAKINEMGKHEGNGMMRPLDGMDEMHDDPSMNTKVTSLLPDTFRMHKQQSRPLHPRTGNGTDSGLPNYISQSSNFNSNKTMMEPQMMGLQMGMQGYQSLLKPLQSEKDQFTSAPPMAHGNGQNFKLNINVDNNDYFAKKLDMQM